MEALPPLFLVGGAPREAEDARAVIVVDLAGERFATDIAHVSEVIRNYQLHRVPGAAPEVDGVVNLRGRVVTVLSGRRLLGLAEESPHPEERVLIVEWEGELFGVRVDRIVGVHRIAPSAVEPPLSQAPGPGRAALTGLFTLQEKVVSLIDLTQVVAAPLETPPASPIPRTGFAVDNP